TRARNEHRRESQHREQELPGAAGPRHHREPARHRVLRSARRAATNPRRAEGRVRARRAPPPVQDDERARVDARRPRRSSAENRRSEDPMKRSTAALLVGLGSIVAVLLVLALWVRFSSKGNALPSLSGQRTTRSYDLSGFTEVRANGQWQVTLVRGDAWAVEVSYPAELESGVDVRMERGALTLRYTSARSWWSDFGSNEDLAMKARVVMPALEAVEMRGASSLDLTGFAGERFAIDASGAVSIDGRDGRYDALALKISGV